MNLQHFLLENLKHIKYVDPTPIQKAALPTMVLGKNMVASFPSGSGKIVMIFFKKFFTNTNYSQCKVAYLLGAF